MLFNPDEQFLVLDQHFQQHEVFDAIATSNVILYLSSRLNQPILHFWTMDNTVILGHMDTKLKSLRKGLKVITDENYSFGVRNAGGLGVISDADILNVSFYFPNQIDISIADAYEATTAFTKATFKKIGLDIVAGEVTKSYCPGTYDLSVGGKKISGQAQRRSKNNIAVMLYLSVSGDQEKRGKIMQRFYSLGNVPTHQKLTFPSVDPSSMANIADLISEKVTNQSVKQLFLEELATQNIQFQNVALEDIVDSKFITEFNINTNELKQRTEALLHD